MGTCILLHFALFSFLNIGLRMAENPFTEENTMLKNEDDPIFFSPSMINDQLDTIPMVNPTAPGNAMPTPIANPTSAQPASTGPNMVPTTTGGGSWCIASQSASPTALQVALDYACGYGGADCSGIQPGAGCYEPNTVRDHASYAFNVYYQKNPAATSCVFGGTAQLTNTDPSNGNCHYASSKSTPSPSPPTPTPPSNPAPMPPTNPTPMPPTNPTPMPPTNPTITTPTDSIPNDATPTDVGGYGSDSEPSDTESSATSISNCLSLVFLGSLLLASRL